MTNHGEEYEGRPCEVVRIHPRNPHAPQLRPCPSFGCHVDHDEAGELCEPCRESQEAIPAVMVQATIADGIDRLAKLRTSDLPEPARIAIAFALADMRRAFDASETLIQAEAE
jgi:hypothetical protein